MKKTKFFALAFAALALGACSSDDVVVEQPEKGGVTSVDAGFVNLSVNLPSQTATRTAENDQFDDGLDSEYDVNNAMLLVFEKETPGQEEKDFKFLKAYEMTDLRPWNPVGGNVTVTANMVQEVPAKSTETAERYALVVLNNNGIIGVDANGGARYNGLPVDKFSRLLEPMNLPESNMRGDGFFMTNAPIADAPWNNGGVNVTTLVNIENNIAETESAALAKPAATVYVERGLSKVTLASNTNNEVDVTGTAYTNDKVTIKAWGLSTTNKDTKAVRDVSDWGEWASITTYTNTNACFGSVPNPYRVYWAIDGNYDVNKTPDDENMDENSNSVWFNILTNDQVTFNKFGSENPQYCLENTFDILNMKDYQTTKVIFKADYKTDNADADGTFYMLGGGVEIYNTENVKNKIIATFMHEYNGAETGLFDSSAEANNVVITLPTTKPGGFYTMNDVTFAYTAYMIDGKYVTKARYDNMADYPGTRSTEKVADITSEQKAKLNVELGEIKYYKNGESYYKSKIKHFGDYYCPWQSGDNTYDANDLGRWGMVRNNWYELSVTSISSPGSPNVPTDTDDWDDEDKYYISVNVNVLSWAKRTQDVEL